MVAHYKIIEELGSGGMGVVYKAEDSKLKRFVAIKFLPLDLTRDANANQKFIQEAQIASALDHQNICTIHEINQTDSGQLFIVMTFFDGKTLRKTLDEEILEPEEAFKIITQIGEGLSRAHAKRIVHRDIKPANIIITTDGVVKILDFGLAKLKGQKRITKSGSTLGTVAYMSPEQALGTVVDFHTDTQ